MRWGPREGSQPLRAGSRCDAISRRTSLIGFRSLSHRTAKGGHSLTRALPLDRFESPMRVLYDAKHSLVTCVAVAFQDATRGGGE
jgi:hypothetical protein